MSTEINKLKLRVLAEISQIVGKALDLNESLADILRILSESLSMKRATVTLVDPEIDKLVIAASYGLSNEEIQRGIYNFDEGITGLVFRTAKPYFVPDIRKEPLFLDKTKARSIEKEHVSFLGVPVLLQGSPIGVLNVDRIFASEVPYEEDIEFLNVVAALISQFVKLNRQFKTKVETLTRENVTLKSKLSQKSPGLYLVGGSQGMKDIQWQLEKVAPTKASVLLLGESGVGKTLIGRIIHELSERENYPFIKVNCAAIPENLLESELFGYEAGAFTGATSAKAGRFEEADKGTVFLDEIGELPLGIQAKLLRVLQDREFERLGANKTLRVDIRIVAATNKNLIESIQAGTFRSDLYYRLNVFPIQVPCLRDRKEDIPRLLNHFLQKVSREYSRRLHFTPSALDRLANYDWPGNVREMENLIERLVILAEGDRIETALIEPYLTAEASGITRESKDDDGIHKPSLRDIEKNEVIAALRRNNWVQRRAAEELELTQRQIGYKIKKYDLEALVAEERAKSRLAAKKR
jgi:Nif-specific regulatory protein